jgi:hypothetical protein
MCRSSFPPRRSTSWRVFYPCRLVGQVVRISGKDVFRICGTHSICDERLYRTLERWLPHKEAIEQPLVKRFGAMHERFSKHIEAGLESMARHIAKSRRALDRGLLERQTGQLLQRRARAAARYSISIEDDDAREL